MIDPRRDDLDTRGLRAVQLAQLVRFCYRVRENRIAAADDVRFGINPTLRFFIPGVGFHTGERMKRADERHVERVL